MKDLIHQLELMGKVAQDLFGVMGGSAEAWEDQFRPSAEELAQMDRYMNASSSDLSRSSDMTADQSFPSSSAMPHA